MKESRNAKKKTDRSFFLLLVKLEDWAPAKMKKISTRHQGRQTSLPYSAGWKNFWLGSRQGEQVSYAKTDRSFFLLLVRLENWAPAKMKILAWHTKKFKLSLLLQLKLDAIFRLGWTYLIKEPRQVFL